MRRTAVFMVLFILTTDLLLAQSAVSPWTFLSFPFKKLYAGSFWGSVIVPPQKDHLTLRGGIATLFGPFYAQNPPDSILNSTLVETTDSVITDSLPNKVPREKIVVSHKWETTKTQNPPEGEHIINIIAGYEYSQSYFYNKTNITSTVTIGGVYIGVFADLYAHQATNKFVQSIYIGASAGFFSLSNNSGSGIDSTGNYQSITFSSNTIVAPEGHVILLLKDGVFVGLSGQYIRFSSVSYTPSNEARYLPVSLDLSNASITIGYVFSTRGLF